MVKTIIFGLLAVIGIIFMLLNVEILFSAGMVLLILGLIIFASGRNPDARAKWFFVILFFVLMTFIATWVLYTVQGAVVDTTTAWMARLWALFVGGFVSTIITLVILFLVVYVSAMYVLAAERTEEIGKVDAFKYAMRLVLDIHGDWILIENGEVTKTKAKSKSLLKKLGGPGKVIVSTGSAVVLQRAGNVTRVCGAGVHRTEKREIIRQAFDLRPQFHVQNIENVITADRIPLTLEVGIGYRIALAKDPDAPSVITDKSNAYPVDEQTLLNAAFNNTAATWHGFGKYVAHGQIRDEIMTLIMDQLLQTPQGPQVIAINKRKIDEIEKEVLGRLNSFALNNGVLFTTVDIREISLPAEMCNTMYLALRARVEAEALKAMEQVKKERNKNYAAMIGEVLDSIKERTGKTGPEELALAQRYLELNSPGAIAESIRERRTIEMIEKMADSDIPDLHTIEAIQ